MVAAAGTAAAALAGGQCLISQCIGPDAGFTALKPCLWTLDLNHHNFLDAWNVFRPSWSSSSATHAITADAATFGTDGATGWMTLVLTLFSWSPSRFICCGLSVLADMLILATSVLLARLDLTREFELCRRLILPPLPDAYVMLGVLAGPVFGHLFGAGLGSRAAQPSNLLVRFQRLPTPFFGVMPVSGKGMAPTHSSGSFALGSSQPCTAPGPAV